jgi:hypothetical protein
LNNEKINHIFRVKDKKIDKIVRYIGIKIDKMNEIQVSKIIK